MLDSSNLIVRIASTEDIEYQKSVHLSAAIASTAVLLLVQFHIRTRGYKFSRALYRSTDGLMWIAMGVVSAFWTTLVLHSAFIWEDYGSAPCRRNFVPWECAGRLAFTPWILNGMFCWWSLRYTFHGIRQYLWELGCGRRQGNGLGTFLTIPTPWNWRIEMIIVFTVTAAPTAWTAIAALHVQLYTLGMLLFATIFVLVHAMSESPYHLTKVHRYAMDDVRIPMLSPLGSGMVYILPSRNFGFDAAFCQKIEYEQRIFTDNRRFFDPAAVIHDDWTLAKCRASVHKIIIALVEKIEYHPRMINDLGYWLYQRDTEDGRSKRHTEKGHKKGFWKLSWWNYLKDTIAGSYRPPVVQGLECRTRDGFTLIGRDVALSLLLWEYLVFERRWQLSDDMKQNWASIWLLRTPKYTGAGPTDTFVSLGNIPEPPESSGNPTKGSASGLEGFLEAVSEVYRLIGQPQPRDEKSRGQTVSNGGDLEMAIPRQDEAGKVAVKALIRRLDEARSQGAALFQGRSIINTLNPLRSVEDYVGQLWEACWAECPSTFGALYLWTTVWYIDNGNIGFHCTPLIPQGNSKNWTRDGPIYMTAWRIQWRHRWHAAVWCQLLVLLPTMINSFLSMVSIP